MMYKEKYTVCFISIGLEYGGAETVLWTYLEKNPLIIPIIITIFPGNGTNKFKDLIGEKQVICLDIKYRKNELRFFPIITQYRIYNRMKEVLKSLQLDAIYINNTLEIGLMKVVVKNVKIPTIGHVHDMKKSIKTYAKRFEISTCFPLLGEIVTVSRACKDSWKYERMKVVYNGVPEPFFYKGNKSFFDIERMIGFVGKASKRKGFDLLFRIIEKSSDDIKWRIAYQGDCYGRVMIDKLKKRKNVQLFHDLSTYRMKDFYDQISILIVPSREDPLPTVILEAMAANVLVIGNNVGGIPEMIIDQDMLFEKDDVDTIMRKIQYCFHMDEKQRKRILEKQMEHVRKHFSLDNKRIKIDRLICDLVEKGRLVK